MKKTIPPWILFLSLIVLYLLHNDFWLWNNPNLVLGIPASLFYHVLFCIVAFLLMFMLVNQAWPKYLGTQNEKESE